MADNSYKTPFGRTINQVAEAKVAQAIQQLGKALPCSVVAVSGSIVTVKFEVAGPFTLNNVTMPMFGPEYIRYPIQVGDKGVTIPADAYLGGMSGLGGGVAGMTLPANLSALVWLPISNQAWSSVDPNTVTIYGPNGVVLRNTASTSTLVLTPAGIAMVGENFVTITVGSNVIRLDASEATVTVGANVCTMTGILTTFDVPNATFTGNVLVEGGIEVDGIATGLSGGAFNVVDLAASGNVVATGEVTAGAIPLTTHRHPGVQTGGGDTGEAIP